MVSDARYVVNIEDRNDPGSPYLIVIADEEQVKALEQTAQRKGFEAVVRHADTFTSAISWMEAQ